MTTTTTFDGFQDYLAQSVEALNAMKGPGMTKKLAEASALCVTSLKKGVSLLACGNGGSACDAAHIGGEIIGRFFLERAGWPCIVLNEMTGTLTALGNDYGYDMVFARQVESFGKKDGVLIAITTSGNSPNVVKAAEKAKALGMKIVGFTGEGGGKLGGLCDVLFDVPCKVTPLVQQAHEVLYHYLCYQIEQDMVAK